ncbi:NADH-quinone oxidoreductase subunit J [Salirhabdus euzebyi]|uniref:NADH-quinone oxidoreductase subunit J n=1 Tax=Salirhabdus euzebyi TaxID=394506 RepID=A0A841Q6E4_9BACI|nr:NADH-quinone oxidoreductase subunit J [Salirhabdus euzebyi]MBB6453971.1 NADH-quinone oxidoreductase subunit J [Salirhabdus euzebyi]
MSGEVIVFLLLSSTAILGGILMLNLKKVIHMLLAVVLTFLSLAGLYVMLSAEFVAAVQILIYSGAVTIVMIFGIMLTKHQAKEEKNKNPLRTTLVGLGIVVFFVTIYLAIRNLYFGQEATALHVNNTEQIGIKIFSYYVIPFELVSIVLLVALMGAVVLAKGEEGDEK